MYSTAFQKALDWFSQKGWKPFSFQTEAWYAYLNGKSGLVNAPTGSGKTYSLLVSILLEGILTKEKNTLQSIWIAPIRALSKEIEHSAIEAVQGLESFWKVGVRTGDSSVKQKQRQLEKPPELLITTPESLHLLLTQKNYDKYFSSLKSIVVDEWHELIGSKRGVLVELALSRLKTLSPNLKIWGISATIGNMRQSLQVLLGNNFQLKNFTTVISKTEKKVEIISVLPDEVQTMPWAGHVGIALLEKTIPIILNGRSTLIFTNTRSFAEIWYQKLLDKAPELSGQIAMHHGSISAELRNWVEDQLHEGKLKAVVCTSSLDLGVDFRPVETIIQVGSPKGVARFLQRAGRSGHQPDAVSKIYFLPTNTLELIEAAALRDAIEKKIVEDRVPYLRSFDVLSQYLITLAVSDGFRPDQILQEVRGTSSFSSITDDEWLWLLNFISTGGHALTAYDEYRKVTAMEGLWRVENKRIAYRHRLSIGTIVGDNSLLIKLRSKYLGSVEEYFISSLHPGDTFWFAGRSLELVRIKDMEAHVKLSKKKSGRVPSWQGGRMPLSSQMSEMLRNKIDEAANEKECDDEMRFLRPLMNLQRELSHLPKRNEFLIEYFHTDEGYHVVMYPFEGRNVHEGLAALVAYRLAQIKPITFSLAMNDYGFELLSDQEIPIYEAVETDVLSEENLSKEIQASINATEMARRKFRDIATIAGLVFKGFPGKPIREKHLQSSAQLFFNVFNEYDSTNLLLLQAYEEVMDFQLEETRMRKALQRIHQQKIVIKEPVRPTPFAFPIMVDRLSRDKLTTESMEDRIMKMMVQHEK
ncbi:MAG: ATP-dependent DNA helicase [Cytophagales bacterium]|jgi:ATP-dependent Lhr-like helicase|nr:ligase-associated DNA damage response DEXH box helicase [Bacteroidota bacterium]MBS1980933.1 ligase-associated DNA damage response DEXH box helicase [Bacteroidota bacterium]WHZ08286.1 MAG: ATP-dependent DNA helicase [Cytophagales bacterium]